ncbi:MAG TPA: SNF2-related protein, partial [Pirellulales bacterium]|nr:SNF2-related protein [Pirellulales bacterium]
MSALPAHMQPGHTPPASTWSWLPPAPPRVFELALRSGASPLPAAFSVADWPSAPPVSSLDWSAAGKVGVASIRLPKLKVKVNSFQFPLAWQAAEPIASEQTAAEQTAATAISQPAAQPALPATMPQGATRIKPPKDIVKLADRLFYVLQPPLEALAAGAGLRFPFQPYPYQMEGAAFLYPRFAAVLADEMGLGKTMQAITAVRLLLRAGEVRSVLLVCPKPLVTNWQREFHQWAPEIPLTVVEGESAKRRWQWQLPDCPVRLANYELLQRDHEVLAQCGLSFDLMILDESQRIKNRSSTTSQIVRSIPRRRSWALTGTPVENSPDDLVGIFEFVAAGVLHEGMKPRRMGQVASEYVLRRTKDKVLEDLPPKTFRDADIELAPQQRETYRLAEEEGVLRLEQMGQSVTIQHVFELVLRLKQVCNFDPATGASAKLERLSADLEEIAASGRKAVVFSQWVETLRTLSERLPAFSPLEYHGQIPSHKRDAVLNEFRDNPRRSVLLISYGAGGVGLNLQFAGYV